MPPSMASTSAATHISMTVVRASEVERHRTLCVGLPNLYVQVKINNECRQTKVVNKSLSPHWDERLSFELPSADRKANVRIRIMHKSRLKDSCTGEIEVDLNDLLEMCTGGKEVELRLNAPRRSASMKAAALLHIRLETVDAMMSISHGVDAAEQAIRNSGIPRLVAVTDSTAIATVGAIGSQLSGYSDLYQSVGNLISKLDLFVSVIDRLSQVHPYVNFTWQVASMLYKTISHQFKVEKKIVDLMHLMEDTFSFIQDTDFLRDKTQYLERTIPQLLKQTNECCLFIKEYASHTFIGRMLKIDVDGKVDEFMQSLRSLKESIESGAIIQTAFVSMRMSSEIDTLFLSERLHPERMDAFNRPKCLPGTRTEMMNEVMKWALSDSEQNVLWLHGVAGSGKSTVSTTIAEHFRDISRLGAHLFFERGKSDPSCVIRTLAYKLASFDSSVQANVIAAIKRDSDIAQATSSIQFENLLHCPLTLSREAMHGPIVIVLDALDECGTEKTRRNLMESFRKGLPDLPRNFRFLITSRKEPDINQAFSIRPDRILSVELEHGSESCRDDVLHYLECSMRNVFEMRELPIPDGWQLKISRLATAAAGLFIWASTAVKLVDCDNPAPKFTDLATDSQQFSGLEQLYNSVLSCSGVSFDDESSRTRFSHVLGLLLLSRGQVSDITIDGILGLSSDEPSRLILSRLQSVLVFARGEPVHFCHTSFRDYILSPERQSNSWFINLETEKEYVASRCFDVMRGMLRFNICDIQSSYIRNDQISGLSLRIKANIPSCLKYACLFWTQHLLDVRFLHPLLNKLSEFLDERLLYWLEVMSLLGKADMASPALLHAMNWVSSHNADALAFLRDARRLITTYLPAISQAISHIYVSFLLFASMESKFIMHYLKRDLPVVQVEQIGVKQQSSVLKELTGHTGRIYSIALSPDGTHVVSGSRDKTIRVWDAESGRIVSGPLEEHIGDVHCVAFSPDGARIVSGSLDKTIRIWDVESGQLLSEPLDGHSDAVRSVAFSPDGMLIVSGSDDKTVIVWEIGSRRAVPKWFKGHTDGVNSVVFSPSGRRIASGSNDMTIRIWDVEHAQTICVPLKGHATGVTSVAFSRDGTRLASGSWDCILIWDAESGQCTSKPYEGDNGPVNSIAFSPDEKCIMFGLYGMAIRIGIETGQVDSVPFGRKGRVLSVAFSHDGTRVLSGSFDATIRIWDAESVQTASEHFEGYTDSVYSVAFSPDGRRIVSTSDDEMIRIWDAESGRTVSGPFGEGDVSIAFSVALSADGRHVASGSTDDATIRWWDAESGNVDYGLFEGHDEGMVNCVCFSPDGTRVAAGSDDAAIQIWDVESGQTISGPLMRHESSVCSVAFSPDGRRVVSGSGDNTTIVWDVENGAVISGPLKGHKGRVLSVAFSPGGTRVVSGSGDKTIIIWDIESGQVVAGPFEGHTDWVGSVAFSPDGALVVSGSGDMTVRVWDADSGQAIFAPFTGHVDSVSFVAFSPDGRRVISGSRDFIIRVWNVKGQRTASPSLGSR